jgi:hypothetical protein
MHYYTPVFKTKDVAQSLDPRKRRRKRKERVREKRKAKRWLIIIFQ